MPEAFKAIAFVIFPLSDQLRNDRLTCRHHERPAKTLSQRGAEQYPDIHHSRDDRDADESCDHANYELRILNHSSPVPAIGERSTKQREQQVSAARILN